MDRPPSKKGLSFVAARDYVLQKAGREAWASVLEALPGEDADAVSAAVDMGWYPLDLHARLLRAIDTRLGEGDLTTLAPIARFEAERDVPTTHHLLLQMGDPADLAEKMAELWPRDHSSGHLRIERRGDRALDATLVDWAADEVLCLGFQAYFQRALELAGARDVRCAHSTCRARG
ncbi:MAG: hypothetical protein ABJE95_35445, partial [Byssovorax sp.]